MISIQRSCCPQVLQEVDQNADRYNCSEVGGALSQMQHEKCCYCEKKIGTSGHEQAVEHFRPRRRFPGLKNTWSNLLHACSDCNGKKWCHFPVDENDSPLLIDPSDASTNPEDHFDFNTDDEDDVDFGRILAKKDSERGKKTIEVIGLDRIPQRKQRVSTYIDLYRAYLAMREVKDEVTRKQKQVAFEMMLGANNLHAAFARAFARRKRLDTRFGIRIMAGAEVRCG